MFSPPSEPQQAPLCGAFLSLSQTKMFTIVGCLPSRSALGFFHTRPSASIYLCEGLPYPDYVEHDPVRAKTFAPPIAKTLSTRRMRFALLHFQHFGVGAPPPLRLRGRTCAATLRAGPSALRRREARTRPPALIPYCLSQLPHREKGARCGRKDAQLRGLPASSSIRSSTDHGSRPTDRVCVGTAFWVSRIETTSNTFH